MVLACHWCPSKDSFSVKHRSSETPLSRKPLGIKKAREDLVLTGRDAQMRLSYQNLATKVLAELDAEAAATPRRRSI